MTYTDLMTALDETQPLWATRYADQTDLRELAQGYITVTQLRGRVARELFEVCRAAVHAGLLKEPT